MRNKKARLLREAARKLWYDIATRNGFDVRPGWTLVTTPRKIPIEFKDLAGNVVRVVDQNHQIRTVGWRPVYKRMKKWFKKLNRHERTQYSKP